MVRSGALLVTLLILIDLLFFLSLVERVHGALVLGALFSLIDVGSGLAAYVVFLFFSF